MRPFWKKMIDYESECQENHIKLITKDINCNGCFINLKSLNIIVKNPRLSNNEVNCVMCEELGHFYTKATYNINCNDLIYISKQEYKAKKYAYERLVPLDKLKQLSAKYSVYEICDKLDVTYEFLQNAYCYYKGKYGI